MYRTIRGAMYDEFNGLRPKALRRKNSVLDKTIISRIRSAFACQRQQPMVGRRPHR